MSPVRTRQSVQRFFGVRAAVVVSCVVQTWNDEPRACPASRDDPVAVARNFLAQNAGSGLYADQVDDIVQFMSQASGQPMMQQQHTNTASPTIMKMRPLVPSEVKGSRASLSWFGTMYTVGPDVGCAVGRALGRSDGLLVGEVGSLVGTVVGPAVGCPVGAPVGQAMQWSCLSWSVL